MFKPVVPQVNFPEMEKRILDHWYKSGIVDKYLHKNDTSKKRFSFLDGPITANNPMGVHHAWGRTFKDLWQRFANMRGFKGRFQNGFDCQGLWVEVEVEKELGIRNKKDIENLVPGDKKASIDKFVQLCKERVYKFSKIQTQQSIRLGYFMDWEHSYYTMSPENNYMIWHFLKTCHENGWIYKGRDSVPWCPRCETAISQHEMLTEDYKELTHETVFIKFSIFNFPASPAGRQFSINVKNLYLLVWTTTPWTVPANVAVGVNTKFTYGIWENKQKNEAIVILEKDENGNVPTRIAKGKELSVPDYIFAEEKDSYQKVAEVKGEKLIGLTYKAPFDHLPRVIEAKEENPQTFHTVVNGSEIVVATEGTGLLHVATGAGKEDFDLGKKEKLSVISVIGDDATYLDGLGEFSGQNAKKHPEIIIDYLKKHEDGKYLLKTMRYTHRYPACWRCKAELVWKVTDEWYIAMDRPSHKASAGKAEEKTLRERMVEVAKKINWIPGFGLERELDWLKNMHDWLISKKNRYWGLALPIYECKKCGHFEVLGGKEELEKRAVAGLNEFKGHSPHKPWIDRVKIKCPKCGQTVARIEDVGNPWLDAGIVSFSTLVDPVTSQLSYTSDKKYFQNWFPADFITESFPGQFKNWFYSLIAMSTVLENTNPFRTVLGFGTLLGEDGRPMHKSWGNAIEFNEGADKIGVDVMRWMYVTHNPAENLCFGYKKADEIRRRFHLKLWNVYNFLVSYAIVDLWKPKESQKLEVKNILDRWILIKLDLLTKEVTQSMEKYDAFTASNKIEEFVDDLSLWYVRRTRERIGPTVENTPDKETAYATLHSVLVILTRILAPFTPFISEEIYRNLTGEDSVHLADFPQLPEGFKPEKKLVEEMELVRKICELGHAKRKEAGIKVRQPLKKCKVQSAKCKVNEGLKKLIKDELNVKEVEFIKGQGELNVEFETKITPDLADEGKARELVRQIQIKRKELGCGLAEKVRVTLPSWPENFHEYIKKETLARELFKGNELLVNRS